MSPNVDASPFRVPDEHEGTQARALERSDVTRSSAGTQPGQRHATWRRHTLPRTATHVLIYRLGCAVASVVPRRLLLPVFLAVGDLVFYLNSPRTKLLKRSLALITGTNNADLMHAAARSRARYWYEYLCLPSMSAADIDARTSVDGLDLLDAAVSSGRGVVLGALHSRNWDFSMARIANHLGQHVYVPCGDFEPASVLAWVIRDRAKHGIQYLPPHGGPPGRFQELRSCVERGGVVVVVTDVAEPGGGCAVDLAGQRAVVSTGAAALAIASGSPLLPLYSWYDDDGFVHAVVGAPIEVPGASATDKKVAELTQRLACRFGDAILAHPADWHGALDDVLILPSA